MQKLITAPAGTVSVQVVCNGVMHLVHFRDGVIRFQHHRIADLAFRSALDASCRCAEVFFALRNRKEWFRLPSLLGRAVKAHADARRALGHGNAGKPETLWINTLANLQAEAINKRFEPIRKALLTQGLVVNVSPLDEDGGPMAMMLRAGFPSRPGHRLGSYAYGTWRLDPVQIVLAAAQITRNGSATPFVGHHSICRTCGVANPPAEATQGHFPHLGSHQHLVRVFTVLQDTLRPATLLPTISEAFLQSFSAGRLGEPWC
jgi:hypothetical protein